MRFFFPNLSESETAVLKRLNDFYFSDQHFRILRYETIVHCNHTSGQDGSDSVGEPSDHLHDFGGARCVNISLSFS
jgi:hypothetical protein